jgi:uncharacterized protein
MSETVPNSEFERMPNYPVLARFLLEPFLDYPEELRISCELLARGTKYWVRISMSESDRGRAYGRGGRNIQSIRQILENVGQAQGHVVSVEIHEENRRSRPSSSSSDSSESRPKAPPIKRVKS